METPPALGVPSKAPGDQSVEAPMFSSQAPPLSLARKELPGGGLACSLDSVPKTLSSSLVVCCA